MVETCRGVGQVLLLLCTKTCGNGENGCGLSVIYPHLHLLLRARCRRLCVHGVNFYRIEGFNSVESWRDSCGTVFYYVNRVRGFRKCTLRNRGGARVRCPGSVCRWREVDSLEVSRQGDDPCWCGVWRFLYKP